MPTCSPWTWPCLSYARVPRVAPGCLNTLFPSVAWKVKGRDVQVWALHPPPLCQLSFAKPAIDVPSTYQSAMRGKLNIIGITQCLTLPFKPSHQQSRVSSFQLTDQFCTFSIMMAGREEMKKAAQHVSFDFAQSHPLMKERPVFAHRTKQRDDEKKVSPCVKCSVFTKRTKH